MLQSIICSTRSHIYIVSAEVHISLFSLTNYKIFGINKQFVQVSKNSRGFLNVLHLEITSGNPSPKWCGNKLRLPGLIELYHWYATFQA